MIIPTSVLIAVMITWGILGTGAGFWFLSDGNAFLKRKLWVVFNILTGLFIFLISFAAGEGRYLFVGVCLLVIVPLTIRYMRFCTQCDRTTYCQYLFKWPSVCEHCGADFNKKT
jgi:hypothetical protein